MGTSRTPNRALRGLLTQTGWTEDQLARRVNALAAESGLVLRLDRRSVAHWLAGRRPRPPVPGLIAEALARGLGHTVTLDDIGLDPRPPAPGGRGPAGGHGHTDPERRRLQAPDPATALTHLARTDDHPQGGPDDVYSLAALTVPTFEQATSGQPGAVPAPRTPPAPRLPAGAGPVVAAEQMAGVFSDLDTSYGGGHSRKALSTYLAYQVMPHLRARIGPALRRRLLSATNQLVYLCGFMCFDNQQHALAQRYYRVALDLATENNDPAAYAVTLRAMSVQARALGHYQHALALAETAAATSRAVAPVRQAFLYGQVAVATAATGARADALSALSTAERRLDQTTSRTAPGLDDTTPPGHYHAAPMGHYHPAALAHQQAAVRALLGDHDGAAAALTTSLRLRPPAERRSRAITTARLAELQLQRGHLEQATRTWHSFLDDLPHLTSARATAALNCLRSKLQPHATHVTVKALLTRAATL
ncbi:hypothetical protein [Actinomadura rubrisoli]|uniref:Transcriptional regulator n=1 Tax=Actinomadura rubrisoli TaxID=2530368 RepID=A0A4R5BB05_9ACTN|nr:hypothetical protein [Actinomadura rubrisoli]TDD82685.1 hypothetical protein E1298_22345 [Actinomadura rubrisoli]